MNDVVSDGENSFSLASQQGTEAEQGDVSERGHPHRQYVLHPNAVLLHSATAWWEAEQISV